MTQRINTAPAFVKVHVPLSFVGRGGRKQIKIEQPVEGLGQSMVSQPIVRAIARAYRWRKQIESGQYSSITELAKAQKINQSYACRMLRLTLLAPVIVEALLNGTSAEVKHLAKIAKTSPRSWPEQVRIMGFSPR
jgi:hypothetical protein